MPNTFELIASSTVGVLGATEFDFTSIPSTYTDLQLVISARSNSANQVDFWRLRFNNDSGSNYFLRILAGGAAVISSTDTNTTSTNGGGLVGNLATSNTFSNISVYVPNYAGSNQKSLSGDSVAEDNAAFTGNLGLSLGAGLWNQTTAINRVTFLPGGGTLLLQHSTAYLYGVKNA
jgi:hypothetical protein